MRGLRNVPKYATVSGMAGTGTPTHPPTGDGINLHMNVVDAAQQSLHQAMLDAGFKPVAEPDPPRKVRHLTLIRGGKL